MESDRAVALTVRAAARGVVDFSRARVLDAGWWRRSNLLIRSMADDDERAALTTELTYRCGLLGAGLTEESFKSVKERAGQILDRIDALHRPWSGATRAAAADSLADLYRRQVGDPRDPAFMAKLEADLEADRVRRAAAAGEDDMARIDRLTAERHARRAAEARGRPPRRR